MYVVTVREIEDCVDGSLIREVQFDDDLDTAAIRRLQPLGNFEYYADFPRPFFRISTDDYQLKGVEGTPRLRLWCRSETVLGVIDEIRSLISNVG